MLKTKWFLSVTAACVFAAALMVGCSEEEEPALALVSLTADGVDLNGATSAIGIKTGASIVATFNVDLDASAGDFVSVIRDYDDALLDVDITINGAEMTIDPADDFNTGTLVILNFDTGIKTKGGNTLKIPFERTFTTEGSFVVPGAFAHWTFEDNAVDIIGGRGPSNNGSVAITYEAGRKAEAGKAASFNGTTSIIEIPNGSQLMKTGDWTMSIWVKAKSGLDKGQFVLGLGAFYGFQFEIFGSFNAFKMAASWTNGTDKYSEDMWADGEGNLGWQGWTYSKDFRGSGGMSTVTKDKWAHYVFVYNSTAKTGTVYLNGEKVKEQDFDNWPDGDIKRTTQGMTWRGALPDVADELALGFIQSRAGSLWDAEPWGGYDQPGANHFYGSMDDLLIYHKALTAGEVSSMYNSGKP